MALKAPPRSLPSALCWPHTLWVPTNSQSHQPGRSCLEKTGGPTEQQSSASPGSECPSGTQGLRGSCHPQSGKLDVCYANVHRHTKLPRFLEEFTLGICLWSQRPANFTPGRSGAGWVGAPGPCASLRLSSEKLLLLGSQCLPRPSFPPLTGSHAVFCLWRATFVSLSPTTLGEGFVSCLFGSPVERPALAPTAHCPPIPAAQEGQLLCDPFLCFHPCCDGAGPGVSGSQLGAHSNEGN